jgi:hypothetical protein
VRSFCMDRHSDNVGILLIIRTLALSSRLGTWGGEAGDLMAACGS